MSVHSRARPARPARRAKPDEAARLRGLLADAQAALRAIRMGQVDAVVVESKLGPQVYTLDGAEFNYRSLIESMNEGALVLTRRALILYANVRFARMVERPLEELLGSSLYDLLSVADRAALRRLLKHPGRTGATVDVLLPRPSGTPLPAKVSLQHLQDGASGHVSFGMVVSDLTEVRKREELLRRFSHGLLQMQESARQQMGTDLGDNIAQMLCSILVRCQLLADRLPAYEGGFREEALQFAELLRTTASEVHRISADLRPHGLEILGLVSALRGVVAEFAARMGVPIHMYCARMTARLPARTELALYRVLQDALRNVERHARARHVRVTLRRRGPVVRLVVKDDGIGFDPDDREAQGVEEGRFGLLSMRERASAVGGSLRVKSRTSAGTEIRLDVPLSPKPAAGRQRRARPAPG